MLFKLVVTLAIVCLSGSATGQENFGECVTPTRAQGLCIRLRSCQSLFTLLQKNPLAANERTHLQRSQCGWDSNQPLVCCPDSFGRPTNGGGGGSSLLPDIDTCGKDVTGNRIIGGNATALDEYPWMVLLQYSKPNNLRGFHCGGVLISSRYVVTASHCVNGKDIPTTWTLSAVRLGEWDLTSAQDCVTSENNAVDCSDPPLDIPIEEKIPHENYNPQSRNQANDIALLRLQQPVAFTDFIIPICLPRADHLRSGPIEGIRFDVAGWGKTETVSQSNVKLKVGVNGVSLQQCNGVYSRQGVVLGDTQMCAGGLRGYDSCRGDSGGPLMTLETSNGRTYWYLAGVVSFGPSPCGQEGWPGVYTRVGSYVDWIESKLRP